MYNVRPYLLTIVYGDMDHERLVGPSIRCLDTNYLRMNAR